MRAVSGFSWLIAASFQPMCLVVMIVSAGEIDSGGDRGFRQIAARVQIRAYSAALSTYRQDVGEFPTTEQGLVALRLNPGIDRWNGPYVRKDICADPWGRPYIYRSDRRDFEILSLGLDGKPGGKNASADVSSRRFNAPQYRVNYGWGAIGVISAAGFFGYPFLPLLLRRLNAKWPARRS